MSHTEHGANMIRTLAALLAAVAVASLLLPAFAQEGTGETFVIRAGRVLTMSGPDLIDGGIVVVDGKITAVGRWAETPVPDGARVLDHRDRFVIPGLVDLHNHIAGSLFDLNDTVYQVNPEMRVLETIIPGNDLMKAALQGGVTSVLYIPGSGSNMGGFGALVKTAGRTVEDQLIRFPGALKIAQAGNPERWGGDLGAGRMGMNWMIRNVLVEGREYHEAWTAYEEGSVSERPEINPRLEYFRGLYRKEFPILVHTQMMQVVQSTYRILSDELGLWVVISHATFDSFKNAPEVAERELGVNVGPRQIHYDREGNRILGVASEWYDGGVRNLSINTDSPVVPEEDLWYQAAMAVRYGLPERAALEGLTIRPAEQIGIADRVGSIEVGKDADLVILNGPPLDVRSRVEQTWIEGRLVYDRKRDGGRY